MLAVVLALAGIYAASDTPVKAHINTNVRARMMLVSFFLIVFPPFLF